MKNHDFHRSRWDTGDWTDDSDQMILILLSLLDNNGKVSLHVFSSRAYIIVVFSNMRTLKFKAQLTIRFFVAVNHNYGDSQRTLKHKNEQNGSKSTNHDQKT